MVTRIALLLVFASPCLALAVAPTTGPATQSTIELNVYVPGDTVQAERGGKAMPIILEVTNRSQAPLRVSDRVQVDKATQNEVRPFVIPGSFPPANGDKPVEVSIRAVSVYHPFVPMGGWALHEHGNPHYTLCPPGQTVLLKVSVRKEIFQPGECQLLVSLLGRGAGAASGVEIARAQLIDLKVQPQAPE